MSEPTFTRAEVRELIEQLGVRVEQGQLKNARGLMALAQQLNRKLRLDPEMTPSSFTTQAEQLKRPPSGVVAAVGTADTDPSGLSTKT